MDKLSLYINNKKADIGDDFNISLNYSFSDIETPTAVKNSFTKTVTLLGTKNNNAIFERYFDIRHRIANFDPTQRIPFTLFLGSDILESGYLKIENITAINHIYRYSITLYGGLGDFFYSLSSSTLEDLSTYFGTDVSINRQTVYDDWVSYVQADTNICWIPEYGGVFDDFSNNKVYYSNTDNEELPEELDQFQIGDFRSYLQRPGAYVSSIIQGICSQSGFDVSIDDSFATRSNPYWENLVVSFPMLDLTEKGQRWFDSSVSISNKSIGPLGPTTTEVYLNFAGQSSFDFSNYGVIQPSLSFDLSTYVSTSYTDINEIAFSIVPVFKDVNTNNVFTSDKKIVFVGYNSERENTENEKVIYMRSLSGSGSNKQIIFIDPSTGQDSSVINITIDECGPLVKTTLLNNVIAGLKIHVDGATLFYSDVNNASFVYRYANPENLHSNRRIHFNDIANNGIKQSDFLLSWAKAFGLLFKQDKNTKKIDILSRNSYFSGYKILDWSEKLDLSKELTINPLTFDKRFYSFKFNEAKSSYLDAYKKEFGSEYGQFLYDTEYEINSDTKELLEGTVFTSPITTTEYLWKFYFETLPGSGISYSAKTIYDPRPRPSNFSWDGHVRKRENNEMQLYFRLNREAATERYWLSDDLPIMVFNQDFSYIWPGLEISAFYTKNVDYLPVYTDYISSGQDGFTDNFSLQFSKPEKSYNGLSYSDTSAGIYSRFWENYINDLYDKNNKIVTGYFNLDSADMLNFDFKNFVFIDGVIYHVNKIFDYNPLQEYSTKVELVQVNDIDAYVNGQRYNGSVNYYLSATRTSGTIDNNGGYFMPGFITNSQSGPYVQYNSTGGWISYSSISQALTISSYSGTTDRTGYVIFAIPEDTTKTVRIDITQTAQAIEYYLTPSSDSASITWPAQTAYSNFSTNGTIVKSSGSSWLTVENGVVKAAANSNDFSQQVYSATRTGTINVTLTEDNTKTSTISVQQAPNYFIRTQRNPNVNLYSLNVGTASYIDVDPQLFSNGTITYVGVDENWLSWDPVNNLIEVNTNTGTSTRVGIVTFGVSEGTEELEFEIYQPGTSQYYITPTSTSQTITASAQNVFQFTTNGSLMIDPTYSSVDASWLDLETNIAGYTFVTADENGLDYTLPVMSNQRTGTLHLTLDEDSNIDASITVIQAPTYYIRSGANNRSGATYTYAPDSSGFLTFDPDLYTNTAGTVHYFINNDASNWLTYDPDDDLIYGQPNNTGVERQGYVSFYIDESNDEQMFIIKQKGDDYFRITNLDNTDMNVNLYKDANIHIDLKYRVNGGTWAYVTVDNVSHYLLTTVPANGYIEFDNSISNFNGVRFRPSTRHKVSGKLSTLAVGDTSYGGGTSYGAFHHLFADDTSLTSAADLIMDVTLYEYSFQYMFSGCTSLSYAPELPATTLSEGCYKAMFNGCTSLDVAPELPATTLADYCYDGMFTGCSSLTEAPELPATTLVYACYRAMFKNCSGLSVPVEIPATTATGSYNCYQMFSGCSNLQEVTMKIGTLTSSCYYEMFYNCSRLIRIISYATDISANYCLLRWVTNVGTSGVLKVPSSMVNQYSTGASGIPSTWTYQEIS